MRRKNILELTIQTLSAVVKRIPVGTNLGIVQLMWAMINGSFLSSRGSIFTALSLSGFSAVEVRRIWRAFGKGQWSITRLLTAWREHIVEEKQWKAHSHEGYRAISVDITNFHRPKLKNWIAKMYQGLAGKSLKGIGIAIVADVGSVEEQRIAIPRKLIRSKNEDGSEKELQLTTLKWVAKDKSADEVSIFDAGFKLAELHEAALTGFVVRQSANCTARRNSLPTYGGKGARPKFGKLIRPLARTFKTKTIAASSPDTEGSFKFQDRIIKFHSWHELVRTKQKVSAQAETFNIFTFFDPLYLNPLVLAVDIALSAQTTYLFYRDRWPIEQLPLVSKQLLGCKRAFTFSPESIFRLPELSLLAGNILTYLAATSPTVPSGFWDHNPKKHQGAFAGL